MGALDALTRLEMQSLIERLWKEQGFTAILVTHDVSEAVQLADRIILLDKGQIAQSFQVNLPRPRSLDLMSTPEFKQLRSRVDYLVHAEEDELDPALQDLPKIPRMTQVSTEK